jgi:fructokinase
VIVCWGELLWDLFPDTARLGGAAANVAYHVAQLGEPVRLISRVGDDELGRRAVAELASAGVDTQAVQMDPAFPTGTVRVDFTAGQARFSMDKHAAWDRIDCDGRVGQALRDARVVVFGTLAQRTPLARGALGEALALRPAGAIRLCDLNIRPPFASREVVDAAVRHADVFKLNETEAERLGELFDVADPVSWLLDEHAAVLVALTRGERGCLLVTPGGRAEHAGFSLQSDGGDCVGAGDAFAAVLACALVRRAPRELDAALLAALAEHANLYASFVASASGAMPAIPAALRARVREMLGP